jgi:antitoxin component YwqK of YwqJK toxin-antitoxin module
MVRPTRWISTLTIGLALACEAAAAQAQHLATEGQPTRARLSKADYVAESQDDDDAVDSNAADSDAIEPNASSDGESQGEYGIPRSVKPLVVDGSATSEEPTTEVIKERFANGSVKIERRVIQDAQSNYVNHGEWKMWDERGNLVAQGEYQNGDRVGTWVRWYRNVTEADLLTKVPYQQFPGPFVSQATFKHDQLDGKWTIYDSKMRKISQWSFADGKRHGASIWWHANGHKMREIQYRDGEMDGPFLEWTADGKQQTNNTYQAGRKLAAKLAHYGDTKKKSEGMYLFAKDVEQTPDDWWNCKLLVTSKAGSDEKHGAWASWYPNGQAQLEGAYEHDVQIGQFTWWHSNGQKSLQGNFDHGKQDGDWTWWHSNGQKSIHGEYAHGNPTGRWTWWKEDGKVAQSADLSHSEGVVIETPRTLEPTPSEPRLSKPSARKPSTR